MAKLTSVVLLTGLCGPAVAFAQDAVASEPTRVVVEGQGLRITAGDLAESINEAPPALRGDSVAPEALSALVLTLTQNAALALKAQQDGLLADPAVRRQVDALLAQLVLERAVLDPGEPSDADIASFYEAHIAEYTSPEKVRLTVLAAASEKQARTLAAKLRGLSTKRFAKVWKRVAAGAPRYPEGSDLGWLILGQSAVAPELVNGGFSLTRVGQTAVVRVPANTATADLRAISYVIRLDDRIATSVLPLSEVKGAIASRLRAERRSAQIDALVSRLFAERHVVFRGLLDAVRIENLAQDQ